MPPPPRRLPALLPPLLLLTASLFLLLLPRLPLLRAPLSAPLTSSRLLAWDRDHHSRQSRACSNGRAAPRPVFARWLHIPKTGTSFANTLIRWGCPTAARAAAFVVPRKERPADLPLALRETLSWDWLFNNASGRIWLQEHCARRLVTPHPATGKPHYALYMHRALRAWEARSAVAMFRLPLQRTYSNYLHLQMHYNESRHPRESLEQFLAKRQFWSQQAKLLLGRHYRDDREVTRREALKASIIVTKRLRFVGLTEQFKLSCRLFHAMLGGVPHRAQFENVRPGISRYASPEKRASSFRYDEKLFKGWTDPADDVVYDAARRRFWRDVHRFKDEIELDGLGQVVVQKEYL